MPAEHEPNGKESGDRHVRGRSGLREGVQSGREIAGEQQEHAEGEDAARDGDCER